MAESYRGKEGSESTFAGAVVRADRTVDDFAFADCTVGGRDGTDTVIRIWRQLDRPDVQYVFLSGVAPAWYDVLDLDAIHEATDRPVVAVSFEESEGLSEAIEAAFSGEASARRLAAYEALPPRRRLSTSAGTLFVRNVGIDDDRAEAVVRAYTHDRRPEPLWVANRVARRVDGFRRD